MARHGEAGRELAVTDRLGAVWSGAEGLSGTGAVMLGEAVRDRLVMMRIGWAVLDRTGGVGHGGLGCRGLDWRVRV
jgi:hypothetical protein